MPDRRCLTCHFWVPAYPEDDLQGAERTMEARRGFGAALAGACLVPGRGRHATSRHSCDRWARQADAQPNPPPPAYRPRQALTVILPAPALAFAAAAAAASAWEPAPAQP